MKVQVVTNSNGFGMTHDVNVLIEAISKVDPGSEVSYTHWSKPERFSRHHFDLNVFVEFTNPVFVPQAGRNVFVPNCEWFHSHQFAHLRTIDQVWAKTFDCERIFRQHHRNVKHIGWTSLDRFDATVEKEKVLLHVAGASSAKGTNEVIEAMGGLPQYRLLIVSAKPWGKLPPNVELIGRVADGPFRALQNRAVIHLCPSSYEGFGHYLNEARSVAAAIITTNAEPMTDLVGPSFGFGAGLKSFSTQNLAQHKHVDPASLAEMIEAAMGLDLQSLKNLGVNARAAYLADRDTFTTNLKALL